MARSSALDRIRMQAYGASSDKLSAYERINARTTGVGGYSYYTIDKWQKDHDNSYATINDYYSRIGNGDWLSSDDRAAYKTAIDTYTSTGTALRNLRSKLNNSYSPEAEEDWLNWQKSSTSLGSHFADVDAFYGQFADDVAYNNWKMGVTPEEQQKWYQGWFKNGAFSDGYQFGDVTKSLINTAFHVGENATQAAVDATENLIDTHAYVVGAVGGLFNKDFQGKVGDFIGKDLLRTEKTGRAIHNVVSLGASAAFGGAEENSFLGAKSEGLVQSASHMAGSMLLQKVGVPTMATIGVNAFGSEIESAFAQGAGYGEAGISGAASAGAEILFEKLFGGFKVMKGNSVSDGAIKWVSDKIGNSFLRVLAKGGMSATFEGFEELATEFTNAAVKKMTYLNDKEFNEIMNFDTAMDAFVGGVIMGSGGNAIQTGAGLASVGRQDVSPLVNAGLELDPNNRAMQTYQTKLDAGQRINAFDRYEAQNAAAETLRDYDSRQIGGATRDRLNQLGETGNIDRVADALTKRTIGEDLSLRDKAAIRQSQYGERVGNELDRKNIESGMYSSRWAEGIGTKMVNADVYNRREVGADRTVEVTRQNTKPRNQEQIDLIEKTAREKIERVEGFTKEAADAMIKGYDGRINATEYISKFDEAFKLGKAGASTTRISNLSAETGIKGGTLLAAYDLGRQAREKTKESEAIGNEGKIEREGIRLREGGERLGGANSEGQVRRVEGYAGRIEAGAEIKPRDREAADLLNAGREVRVADLGILNGSKTQTVRVVDAEMETATMKRARKEAESHGLKVRFFLGDDIVIEEKNGSLANINGYILGDQMLVRADHESFTAEQITRHEMGHDTLARVGAEQRKVIISDTRKRLSEIAGEDSVTVDTLSSFYSEAYKGSGLSEDEIWEEIICDSLGDMNIFAKDRDMGRLMEMATSDIKNIVDESKLLQGVNEGEGKYSRESGLIDYINKQAEREVESFSTERIGRAGSARELLSNALESVAQNEGEAKRLKEYKANIEGLNEQEKKLWDLKRQMKDLNRHIKELSSEKGTKDMAEIEKVREKDMAEIKKVRDEITKTENRINLYDTELLKLESTSVLKAVVEREKKNAYRAAAEKGREALHKNVVGRNRTAEIHSIQKIAKELDGLLNRGTKERNVKKGGADFVRSALDLSNMLLASDDDLLFSGIKTEYTDSEAKAMDDYMRLYEEYHSYDNAVTENKARRAELRSQMADIKHGFSDALERERKRISNAKASDTFDALIKEYKNLQNSSESYIRETFDKDKLGHIEALKENVGNTTLKDMSLEQLKDVHKAFTITKTMVQNSNKLFVEGKKASVKDQGEQAIHELELKGHKKTFTTPGKKASTFGYNNLKPIYLMERTGSAVLQERFQNVMRGEDTYAKDIYEAEKFFEGEKVKHGYNKWDFKKTKTFDTGTGLKYDLTLGQMMSIYAYSKRGEQAMEHLRTDGFVYDGAKKVKGKGGITYELNDKTAYKISDKVFLEIVNSLTKEQKAFVDATQKYLSDVMGAKGNEVSEKLFGIDLFGEENYFQIRSERAYLERAREQASGEIKIKNKGFTKQTQKGARNAIVLSDYSKIWGEHVSEMSMYHAFTLPLEDFYRVYNYQTASSEDANKKGVIPALSNAYGEGMTQAIDRLLSDLNGGARSESLEAEAKKLISLHKKAKTMASLSVIVQQPSSIIRAQAMVDPKYFVGQKVSKGGHKAKWEEIKTYAPVAIIKEMGHFDVGMGRSSADWIVGEKTVSDHINEVLSKPASYADEVGWISIWDAVKRETARSNPKMNTSSEDFLKKAGERFEDVIRHTQVYDSTLSRSANMRSKSAFMQMLTSFMAEPTTSINMREMALRSGDAKRIARTTAAVYTSTLLNSVLVALPYAFRDDDEDETFAEKYVAALSTSFIDNINPINSIPILKDVWSLAKGYSVERADMSLAEDVLNSFKGVIKSATAEEIDKSTVVNSVIELVGDLSSFLGLPVDNIYRDVKSYINFGKTISREQNGMETTWNSISDALEGAMRKNTPVVGWFGGESKGKRLYDAILAEDDAYVSRFRAEYEEEYADIIDETIRETKIENAYNSAVRKALRDNDPRVEEAALAKLSGDENKYEDLMNEVIEEGIFDAELVEAAFVAEYNYHKDKKKDAELRGKTYP